MLVDTLVRQGDWLFHRRGYLPVLLAPVLAAAMLDYPRAAVVSDGVRNVVWAAMVLVGLAVRAHTTAHAPPRTSGGNTAEQIADDLNVTGFYSVVRHPLYLGNALCWMAVALFTQSPAVVALIGLTFWLYYERIMIAEEAFLVGRFGDRYRAWSAETPAFIPNPRLWVPPAAPLDWRNAVKREYSGAYWLVLIVTLLNVVGDSARLGRLTFDPGWVAFFAAATGLAAVIMVLRRTTDLIGPRR